MCDMNDDDYNDYNDDDGDNDDDDDGDNDDGNDDNDDNNDDDDDNDNDDNDDGNDDNNDDDNDDNNDDGDNDDDDDGNDDDNDDNNDDGDNDDGDNDDGDNDDNDDNNDCTLQLQDVIIVIHLRISALWIRILRDTNLLINFTLHNTTCPLIQNIPETSSITKILLIFIQQCFLPTSPPTVKTNKYLTITNKLNRTTT